MSYSSLAQLQTDTYFRRRVTACAAEQNKPDPEQWAEDNSWQMAAMPGFSDAYASALETGVTNPGDDPSVITDPQILAAVQSIQEA